MTRIAKIQQGIQEIQDKAEREGDQLLFENCLRVQGFALYNETTGTVEEWPDNHGLQLRYIDALNDSYISGLIPTNYCGACVRAM